MLVEMIWQRDCPNVFAARTNLMRAFSDSSVRAKWREWCVDDDDCPTHARGYGSPTILVDGKDIAGVGGDGLPSCRVYESPEGQLQGAPPVSLIAAALSGANVAPPPAPPASARFSWGRAASVVPSLGVALLPKIACPACWPAYAGVLSSFGVSFLIDDRYLFALTAAFLSVAVFFLGFRAARRRGFRPFILGILASAVLLIGKFYFESDPAMFAGVALLMAASLWNSWPRQVATSPACSACEPEAGGLVA